MAVHDRKTSEGESMSGQEIVELAKIIGAVVVACVFLWLVFKGL